MVSHYDFNFASLLTKDVKNPPIYLLAMHTFSFWWHSYLLSILNWVVYFLIIKFQQFFIVDFGYKSFTSNVTYKSEASIFILLTAFFPEPCYKYFLFICIYIAFHSPSNGDGCDLLIYLEYNRTYTLNQIIKTFQCISQPGDLDIVYFIHNFSKTCCSI